MPKTDRLVPVCVRIRPELASKLDGLAARAGRNRSDVMRWLLARATETDLPRAWVEASPDKWALLSEVEGR
jgi:predicted transcriptional regulator